MLSALVSRPRPSLIWKFRLLSAWFPGGALLSAWHVVLYVKSDQSSTKYHLTHVSRKMRGERNQYQKTYFSKCTRNPKKIPGYRRQSRHGVARRGPRAEVRGAPTGPPADNHACALAHTRTPRLDTGPSCEMSGDDVRDRRELCHLNDARDRRDTGVRRAAVHTPRP